MSKLSIVVPAYNEANHIELVVNDLLYSRPKILEQTKLDEVEIIVVNDGSDDETGLKVNGLLRSDRPFLKLVTHKTNCGYGAALKTGFTASTGDFLSFMDGDGTLSPDSFIQMYKALEVANADMTVGARFGESGSHMPFSRKLGNWFFAILLTLLSGQKVKDTASGIRLFKRSMLPLLLALPDGLHFTPAMSTKAIHENLKIIEISVPYSERSGDSKLRIFADGFRFLKVILSIVLLYNPFKVFFLVGFLSEIAGAALLSVPIYSLITQQDVRFSDYIYRSIGGLYFFIAGMQIILFGILARFMVSTFFKRHESGNFIHKVNNWLKVYERMCFYGLFVILVGVVVNAIYFWKYIFGGGLTIHWAWLLLAAGFIIVGLEMFITGVVMNILKDIKVARGID